MPRSVNVLTFLDTGALAETERLIHQLRMSAHDVQATIGAAGLVLNETRSALDAAQTIISAFAYDRGTE